MAGETLDLGEVVRGEKEGRLADAVEQPLDQLIAHQRVEAGEGLIQHQQRGPVAERADERRLHAHPPRHVLQLAVERQSEVAQELPLQPRVPGRIELPQKIEELAYRHPVGQLLALRYVTDPVQRRAANRLRRHPQHLR
jgi:hypothetical protein